MNIQVIAEHSVDLDLLPERANILDAGCRGFEFASYFRSLNHYVSAIDCDRNLIGPYHLCALSGRDGYASVYRGSDPQATKITRNNTGELCKTYSIESLSLYYGVDLWDVIKMDIEGSEREVIMSMDRPYAKQLSIEFHAHCAYDLKTIDRLVEKLESLGYTAVQHTIERRHGLGLNAWDSLFILK